MLLKFHGIAAFLSLLLVMFICSWVPVTYCTALVLLVELLQGDLIQGVS